MPRDRKSAREIQAELEHIRDIVANNPDGLSRQELADIFAKQTSQTLSTRQIQRRLEVLVYQERVLAEGVGPATKYRPPSLPRRSLADGYVPLTIDGSRVRRLVALPIAERKPVGYDPEWLFDYRPGDTWYLPKTTRTHLAELGATAAGDRPAGTFARDVLARLLIDLSWASSRLEGNTYSRLDTQNLIEFGQRAEGKEAYEAQMILNHKAAIEFLANEPDAIGFNAATLTTLHALLSENLLANSEYEGRLRERPVSISGTTYTPTAIPQVIRECFERVLSTADQIPDAFEQAFFMMVHVPYLQPFEDVNKRTSRLAANIPFIRQNLAPLSFIDVPDRAYVEATIAIYEQRRTELLHDVFVFAYERSSAQYKVVRDSVQPDVIRLKYRDELARAVTETVQAGEAPRVERLRERAAEYGVHDEDLDAFAERALQLVLNLHQGSAGRYGLRASELESWRSRFKP